MRTTGVQVGVGLPEPVLAGFGNEGTPGSVLRTRWDTPDIWIRREFDLSGIPPKDLRLFIHHDEDAEVYVNGVLVARLPRYTAQYGTVELPASGRKAPRTGRNTIAIHCHQTGGGQYIEAGFATVTEQGKVPSGSRASDRAR